MRIGKLLLPVIFIFLIVNLIRSFWDARISLRRLEKLRAEVAQSQSQKTDLEKEVEQKRSPEFLEREARDKLGLIRQGERVVIIPENFGLDRSGQAVEGSTPPKDKTPNWKKWRRLIFE